MDSRYLKLEPEEAYWIKKNIKISKETFENILRHLLYYQSLRKKEVIIKNKLKVSFSQLKSKLNLLEFSFPEEERKNTYNAIWEKEKGIKRIHNINTPMYSEEHHQIPRHLSHLHRLIKREPDKSPDEELGEIKRKLERLNQG
jgi:hypothetical protein